MRFKLNMICRINESILNNLEIDTRHRLVTCIKNAHARLLRPHNATK